MSGKLFCRNILIYNVLMGFSSREVLYFPGGGL